MAWVSQAFGTWQFSMSHHTDVFAFTYCASAMFAVAVLILLPFTSPRIGATDRSRSDWFRRTPQPKFPNPKPQSPFSQFLSSIDRLIDSLSLSLPLTPLFFFFFFRIYFFISMDYSLNFAFESFVFGLPIWYSVFIREVEASDITNLPLAAVGLGGGVERRKCHKRTTTLCFDSSTLLLQMYIVVGCWVFTAEIPGSIKISNVISGARIQTYLHFFFQCLISLPKQNHK